MGQFGKIAINKVGEVSISLTKVCNDIFLARWAKAILTLNVLFTLILFFLIWS